MKKEKQEKEWPERYSLKEARKAMNSIIPGLGTLYYKRLEEHIRKNKGSLTLSAWTAIGFLWVESPEGRDFWFEIKTMLFEYEQGNGCPKDGETTGGEALTKNADASSLPPATPESNGESIESKPGADGYVTSGKWRDTGGGAPGSAESMWSDNRWTVHAVSSSVPYRCIVVFQFPDGDSGGMIVADGMVSAKGHGVSVKVLGAARRVERSPEYFMFRRLLKGKGQDPLRMSKDDVAQLMMDLFTHLYWSGPMSQRI